MILTCSFRKRRFLRYDNPDPPSMIEHSCQDCFPVSRHISVFSTHPHHSPALHSASDCTIASVERSGTEHLAACFKHCLFFFLILPAYRGHRPATKPSIRLDHIRASTPKKQHHKRRQVLTTEHPRLALVASQSTNLVSFLFFIRAFSGVTRPDQPTDSFKTGFGLVEGVWFRGAFSSCRVGT